MKTKNLIGWAGLGLLLSAGLLQASCAKSVNGFCQSWVEDTCKAIAGCCKDGKKYDEDQCRVDLSEACLDSLDLEEIQTGERVFNAGAASECFGTVETCADLDALQGDLTYERAKACKNIVTGFRSPGSACSSDKQCQQSGEYALCYAPGGDGVCVNVVLDDTKCSFSFENNELHICPEGKFCDLTKYEPNPNAPPTSREFEFSASCRTNIGNGGKCTDDEGHTFPCAKGLYCDFAGGNDATCKKRKAAGEACNFSTECAAGLDCDSNPNGPGETCQKATADGAYCFSPPKCGDGDCNGNETAASCPMDCGGGGFCGDGTCDFDEDEGSCPDDCGVVDGCGDGVCDFNNGEHTFCTADCCGDGFCDPGEENICPDDCGAI